MPDMCFICFMKPVLYLSILSSSFVTFGCKHSNKKLKKPFLKPSKTKRYIALVFQLITVILVIVEYYMKSGFNFSIDLLHKTLPSLGFTVEVAVLVHIIIINLSWMEDVEELRQLMEVSVYIQQFGKKAKCENRYKNVFFFLTTWISIVMVIEIGCPLFLDNLKLDYLSLVTRILLGLTIHSFYECHVMLRICHGTFIRQILHQVEKEIDLKMNKPLSTVQDPQETDFLRKLRKLRMLYMSVINNIVSKNKRVRKLMISAVVTIYLFQIFFMFLLILTVSGELELNKWHIPTLLKMVLEGVGLLYLFSLTNQSDEMIRYTLTWMYQLQICSRFNASEMREVEVFMNLLANHDTSLGSDSGYIRVDLPFFAGITVDVVVNAMVVTQLYHWFKKK